MTEMRPAHVPIAYHSGHPTGVVAAASGTRGPTVERPRAIVLGTGVIGRVHIDALRRNNVDIVSVVASSEARSIAAAAEFGVPRGDPDLATALRATNPDAVHVCTPDTYHLEHAGASLDAGAHVVCEKPLTTDAGSAGDLYRRAADSGRVTCHLLQQPLLHAGAGVGRSASAGHARPRNARPGVSRGRHVLARNRLGLAPAPGYGRSHHRHLDHRQPPARPHQLRHRQPRHCRVRRLSHGTRRAQATASRRRDG